MSNPIHPLRRWLFERQETASAFATRVNVAPGHLSDIMNGKRRPSLDVIDRIAAATDRAITANDWAAP